MPSLEESLQKSCSLCRRRKQQCDGQLPCARCNRLGHECKYQARKSKPSKSCEVCHKMKQRCDGLRPCGRCSRLGHMCTERASAVLFHVPRNSSVVFHVRGARPEPERKTRTPAAPSNPLSFDSHDASPVSSPQLYSHNLHNSFNNTQLNSFNSPNNYPHTHTLANNSHNNSRNNSHNNSHNSFTNSTNNYSPTLSSNPHNSFTRSPINYPQTLPRSSINSHNNSFTNSPNIYSHTISKSNSPDSSVHSPANLVHTRNPSSSSSVSPPPATPPSPVPSPVPTTPSSHSTDPSSPLQEIRSPVQTPPPPSQPAEHQEHQLSAGEKDHMDVMEDPAFQPHIPPPVKKSAELQKAFMQECPKVRGTRPHETLHTLHLMDRLMSGAHLPPSELITSPPDRAPASVKTHLPALVLSIDASNRHQHHLFSNDALHRLLELSQEDLVNCFARYGHAFFFSFYAPRSVPDILNCKKQLDFGATFATCYAQILNKWGLPIPVLVQAYSNREPSRTVFSQYFMVLPSPQKSPSDPILQKLTEMHETKLPYSLFDRDSDHVVSPASSSKVGNDALSQSQLRIALPNRCDNCSFEHRATMRLPSPNRSKTSLAAKYLTNGSSSSCSCSSSSTFSSSPTSTPIANNPAAPLSELLPSNSPPGNEALTGQHGAWDDFQSLMSPLGATDNDLLPLTEDADGFASFDTSNRRPHKLLRGPEMDFFDLDDPLQML